MHRAALFLSLMALLVLPLPAKGQSITYEGGSIYDLDPPARQSTRMLEAISGADDMQPVSDLAETDILRRLARPVGRLSYATTNGALGHCTASIVADDLLLTNHHCVRDAKEAMLWMGYIIPRSRRGVAQYSVELPPVEMSKALDYALLRVRGRPGNEWGTVQFGRSEPGPRQSLFIIHLPGGFAQRISLGRCRASDPARDGDDLLHVCDTMSGSSGAPIFDNGTRRVVGLHYSAIDLNGLNAGKRLTRLLERSERLAALAPAVANDDADGQADTGADEPEVSPRTPVSAEAEAWAAIKGMNSCAVFERYVTRFRAGGSVFVDFAEARMVELRCGARDVAVGTFPQRPAPTPKPEACAGVQVPLASGGTVCRKPGSGESFKDCPDCPEMVVVPAGSFMMGSPESEEGRYDDEGPQRRVTIAKPFAVGKFEVTFAEWDACVADGGCQHRPNDEGWGRGRRPVINISWQDVTLEYLPWLNRKLGLSGNEGYRLLSEAEWEYAARAGTYTRFHFGDSDSGLDQHAWYVSNANSRTHAVGEKSANAWGLYDMHGNVREWVEDCYGSYKDAPTDGTAYKSGEACNRFYRGGSWHNDPRYLRAADRSRIWPEDRIYLLGFRAARTLNP